MKNPKQIANVLLLAVSSLIVLPSLHAQTPVSAGGGGIGTPSDAPGDPVSSYALDTVDHINYFTGSVNVAIPLLSFGGRGSVGKSIAVPIQRQWSVYAAAPNTVLWNYIGGRYTSGFISIQSSSPNPTYCLNYSQYAYYGSKATTYITWNGYDGSQAILTDTAFAGQPQDPNSSCQPADRGKVFRSTDGSGLMFIANADVHDGDSYVAGTLVSKDGTKYSFSSETYVSQIEDRNGNQIQFAFSSTASGGLYTVTDPIGRKPTINFTEDLIHDDQDVISYPGYQKATRTITVNYALLQNALGTGESLQTYQALFPSLTGSSATQFNPYVISSISLADGTSYTMQYNSYGELVRLTLPTGAAISYRYSEAYNNGSSGVIALTDNINYSIIRPLVERDEYASGGSTVTAKMTYSAAGTTPQSGRPWLKATVTFEDPSSNTLRQENHYFWGNPLSTAPPPAANTYADWWEGLEYQTDVLDASSNVLQSTLRLYQQRPWAAGENAWFTIASGSSGDAQPLHDPQLCQVNTILGSTGAAGSVYVYDQYNNRTGQYDFDYGQAPGASSSPAISTTCPTPPFGNAMRNTQTTYLTTSAYVSPSTNLVGLPTEVQIYDGSGNLYRDTKFAYDGTSLTNYSSITGHDSAYSQSQTTRGNLTSISNYQYAQYESSTVSWPTTTFYYDIAGNVVQSTDANSHSSNIQYTDNFSDGINRSAFVLPTTVTNALGQSSSIQYDFSTEKPTLVSDPNSVKTAYTYSDPLDRVTSVKAAQGASVEQDSSYVYNSPTWLTTKHDLNATGDLAMVAQQYWDGLGRPTVSQLDEGSTSQYVEQDTTYDALGRIASKGIPWRNGSYGPNWPTANTMLVYDALGRTLTVTTADGAVASTSYTGNQTTTKDQAGKTKIYTTDGSGRLSKVVEDPNGLNYTTSYVWSAADDLQTVTQGGQTRAFYDDTMGRIYASTQPEINGTTWYWLDGVGNVTQMQQPNGASTVTKTFTYDGANRPKTVSYSDGTPTATFAWDSTNPANGIGRLTSISNSNSTTTYTYDPLGRPLTSSQQTSSFPSRGFSYAYDFANDLKTETLPSGRTVTTNFDAAARPSTLAGTLNSTSTTYVSSSSYWPTGVPWYFVRGSNNNIWSVTSFNSRLQLQESYEAINNQNTNPQMLFISCPNWGVDTNSNWGAINACPYVNQTNDNGALQGYTEYLGTTASQSFGQTFTYDGVNRLKIAQEGTSGWNRTYNYDQWGNMTPGTTNSVIPLAANSPTAFNTSTNQISAPGVFSYDNGGNLTALNGNTLSYDAEKHVKSVQGLGISETIGYDGAGRRVLKSLSGGSNASMYMTRSDTSRLSTRMGQSGRGITSAGAVAN